MKKTLINIAISTLIGSLIVLILATVGDIKGTNLIISAIMISIVTTFGVFAIRGHD